MSDIGIIMFTEWWQIVGLVISVAGILSLVLYLFNKRRKSQSDTNMKTKLNSRGEK